MPTWTRTTLANGADLIVSEKHDLPLVSFTITFLGGANQFETADRTGVASLTAAMMSEGTKTRDGEALSNALQLLGTSVSTRRRRERLDQLRVHDRQVRARRSTSWRTCCSTRRFPPTALERLRAQRLVALTQAKAQPGAIAGRVFPRVLYGAAHPFGRPATEDSLKAITRDDIVAFHAQLFPARPRPDHRRRRRHGGGA